MARTGYNVEELRGRVDEVENLRDEQKDQRLAEVAHDADHSEDHASKVAVCITNKDLCREPVMLEKRKGHSEEWQ